MLTVIVQFYQRCSDRFQDLVSLKNRQDPESPPKIALAAQWAQKIELVPCLNEILAVMKQSNRPNSKSQTLCHQEGHLEANLLGERSIKRDELIASVRDLSTMASLHHSVVSRP